MNRILSSITLLAVLVACGGSGPTSGGPLTVPSSTTVGTTATSPATSVTTSTLAPDVDTSAPTSEPTTTTRPSNGTSPITVYFLDESGHALAVPRSVTSPGVAAAAVRALIDGPSSSEQASGLSTAFPKATLLLGLDISNSTASVDLSAEFEGGAGSASTLGRLAQLVYTLTEFDSVERVRLLLDGRSVEVFGSEGVVVEGTLTRDDFLGSVPIGTPIETGIPTWGPGDLDRGSGDPHTVVLVAADDYLNVRASAGPQEKLIGRLLPGVTVRATAQRRTIGSSEWRQIETPLGPGWVNSFYLAPETTTDPAAAMGVVAELADRMTAGVEFDDLVSERGLWVAHHAPPLRFRPADLVGIDDDPTTLRWGSNALEPGSPEIQPRTFHEAVTERFVDAHNDSDVRILFEELIEGPNGRPAALALPTELRGFPFVTVHDPGDEAQYEGLDWTTWIVSLAHEEGELRVVGLTLDEWAP